MGQTIKVSVKATVVISDYHKDIFKVAQTGQRATETMRVKLQNLLVSKYGAPVTTVGADGVRILSGGPTFEQDREDKKALAQLAKDKGLKSDQWVRKPYNAALTALYGKLPEAQTPEALRKAAERKIAQEAIAKARAAAAAPAGAPKGETNDRAPTEAEQIDSLVTRIGLIKTADAIVRILKADERTKVQATHLEKMLAKVAEQLAAPTTAA
jgi:hypothetical protein